MNKARTKNIDFTKIYVILVLMIKKLKGIKYEILEKIKYVSKIQRKKTERTK